MSQQPQTPDDLRMALQQDAERFANLLHHLSAQEQERPFTAEGWSVKDFLNHMTHWNHATHALLVAYLHDQPLPEPTPSGNEGNTAQHQHHVNLSLEETHQRWQTTNTYLQHLVRDEIDENRLAEEVRVPWSETDTETIGSMILSICDHDTEHFSFIEEHFKLKAS